MRQWASDSLSPKLYGNDGTLTRPCVILRAHGAPQLPAKPGGHGDLAKEQDLGKFQRGGGREAESGVPTVFKEGSMQCEGQILKPLWIKEAATLVELRP